MPTSPAEGGPRPRAKSSACFFVVPVLVFLAAYWLYYAKHSLSRPLSARPQWSAPHFSSLKVDDAVLNAENAEKLGLGQIVGPESIAFSRRGDLYTGLADGRIVYVSRESLQEQQQLEQQQQQQQQLQQEQEHSKSKSNNHASSLVFHTLLRTGEDHPFCGHLNWESHCGRPLGLTFVPRRWFAQYFRHQAEGEGQKAVESERQKEEEDKEAENGKEEEEQEQEQEWEREQEEQNREEKREGGKEEAHGEKNSEQGRGEQAEREEEEEVLLVADAYRGLLAVSTSGQVAVLADRFETGERFTFLNDLVQGPDGNIYLTHSSRVFQRRRVVLEVLQGTRSGSLIKFDPVTGKVQELLSGLPFPNGIALSESKDALLINLWAESSVLKYSLAQNGAESTKNDDSQCLGDKRKEMQRCVEAFEADKALGWVQAENDGVEYYYESNVEKRYHAEVRSGTGGDDSEKDHNQQQPQPPEGDERRTEEEHEASVTANTSLPDCIFALLPGFPDNIRSTVLSDGSTVYLVGLSGAQTPIFALFRHIYTWPLIKFLLSFDAVYEFSLSLMKRTGLVAILNASGEVRILLRDMSGTFAFLSEAEVHSGFVYIGSFINPYLVRLPVPSRLK